ncbi:MAG: hypothetical protein DMG10_24655 [Acidobacteria bacterium]|nr:MAG: hypothetical protein DMG10_24655 [Acidobacteriota bacterium]
MQPPADVARPGFCSCEGNRLLHFPLVLPAAVERQPLGIEHKQAGIAQGNVKYRPLLLEQRRLFDHHDGCGARARRSGARPRHHNDLRLFATLYFGNPEIISQVLGKSHQNLCRAFLFFPQPRAIVAQRIFQSAPRLDGLGGRERGDVADPERYFFERCERLHDLSRQLPRCVFREIRGCQ